MLDKEKVDPYFLSINPFLLAADADMSHAIAQKVLQAAVKKSEELNEKMNIAIVDKGANLVGFLRLRYRRAKSSCHEYLI